jgi:hypothetical protein
MNSSVSSVQGPESFIKMDIIAKLFNSKGLFYCLNLGIQIFLQLEIPIKIATLGSIINGLILYNSLVIDYCKKIFKFL